MATATKRTPARKEVHAQAIKRIEDSLDAVDMPHSLGGVGVDETEFEAALPDLVGTAFADPSVRTNPRIPLVKELRELLEAGWRGW